MRTFLVGLAFLTLVPGAAAFTSLPPGDSPHDKITDDGAHAAGWEGSTRALREAIRAPDLNEHDYDPELDEPGRIDAGAGYSNAHHCGRDVGADDEASFMATVQYIQGQLNETVSQAEAGDGSQTMAALGRALHALQDCYSHSNIVDMPDSWQAFEDLLSNGTGDAPEGIRLTSYDAGADKPGMPEGDDYQHDKFAKDSADKNEESKADLGDGRTKYETARDLATNATTAFLERVKAEIGNEKWADLQDVKADSIPDRWPVPGLSPALLLAAVLVGAGLAARKHG